MNRLWNFIRSTKRDKSVHDDIGVSDLHKYFSAKFCDSEYTSDVILEQGRATFSERGPDDTFRSSSWAGVTNENPNMRMYILQYFYCKAGKSVTRLVLLAMKKYFNVRLEG